ncbi:MAG: alkaline phosphatase family protein [Rhodospirillales bacterium]|nr:MAG: alkaline phosphatase family protein [Rhodospirillales bacterium]
MTPDRRSDTVPRPTRRAALLLAGATLAAPFVARAQQRPMARIAFGSCADQNQPQPIWDAILTYRPDLFIFAGDCVYGDSADPDLGPLRAAYARQRDNEGFMKARRQLRHMAVWDDHDYGLNDGGAEFAHKAAAKDEFLRFWDVPPDDPRRGREGLYHAETFGPAGMRTQVILLDARWFRSPLKRTDRLNAPGKERYVPDEDPTKTMLGETQWSWLSQRLREPADIRLVVSSVQILAEGHGWERWGNLPLERRKFFEVVRDAKAEGVVLVSGDRHIGAIYQESEDTPYTLTEITSSGLNKFFPGNKEDGPNRLGAVYGLPNFGTVEIDWWERTVQVAVRDEVGQTVRHDSVDMDDLAEK